MDFGGKLFNNETVYFDALDHIQEAFYICDTKKRIVYMNKVAEKIDGFLLKDVKGELVTEVYGIDESIIPLLIA